MLFIATAAVFSLMQNTLPSKRINVTSVEQSVSEKIVSLNRRFQVMTYTLERPGPFCFQAARLKAEWPMCQSFWLRLSLSSLSLLLLSWTGPLPDHHPHPQSIKLYIYSSIDHVMQRGLDADKRACWRLGLKYTAWCVTCCCEWFLFLFCAEAWCLLDN